MPRPKSVESTMRRAFDRLKNDEPDILPKGTPVSISNVAKEAGSQPGSLRRERYPELHREISAYSEIHTKPGKNSKSRKARESGTKRVQRLRKQNERLLNIVNALTTRNEELEREVAILREGKIANLHPKNVGKITVD